MMLFIDFYDLAVYANENWKGGFSSRGIASNAYDYWSDYLASQDKGKPTALITDLLKLLDEDGSDDARYYARCIRVGIGGR